jgi:hypothetical protein
LSIFKINSRKLWGQGTQPGEEREMVSQSFIEGARLVISLLQGDEDLMDMIKDIK